MKRILAALALFSGLGFAQTTADQIKFNVIIRDFQPSHPDFENFDDRWREISEMPYPGSGYTPSGPKCFGKYNAPATANVCEWGYTCGTPYSYGGVAYTAAPAYYGSYRLSNASPAVYQTMHRHEALAAAGLPLTTVVPACGKNIYPCSSWEDPVYITPGMVAGTLNKKNVDDPLTWVPIRNGESCHDTYFDQWFNDVPGQNTTIYTEMPLNKVPGTLQYRIDSRTMPGGAYFPLDTFAGDLNNPNFGKQSIKMWCPPYGSLWANDGLGLCAVGSPDRWKCDGGFTETDKYGDLCKALLNAGGPRGLNAGPQAVYNQSVVEPESSLVYASLLHNYAFTIMGYTRFTYSPSDTFLFSGDDDMWIFIDGNLVADLGGTHLPAEARVVLSDWAAVWGWTPGSYHKLNFFYADRQTDGSNLQITTTMAPGDIIFGAPLIKRGQRDASDGSILMYLNTKLSDASIAQIANAPPGSNYFPILGIKYFTDATGAVRSDTMGLAVTGFSFVKIDSSGAYIYRANSAVFCTDLACSGTTYVPGAGDSLAFNYHNANDFHKYSPAESVPNIKSGFGNGRETLAFLNWGLIEASTLTTVPAVITPSDPTISRPEENIEQIFAPTTLNGLTYQGLGVLGEELPVNSTGEVNLSLYPADTSAANMVALNMLGFGMPPIRTGAASALYTVDTANAAFAQYVVSSAGASNNNMAVSHCSAVLNSTGTGYNNSCLSIGFDTERPFSANVMVYDHLGNFVSRYQANVTADAITKLQNKSKVAGNTCVIDNVVIPAVASAKVRANINIYPFSQTGRKLGDGVYILDVDIIQQPNSYCEFTGGSATPQKVTFSRAFNKIKLGYVRNH